MIRNTIIKATLIVTLVMASSCNKWLELKPQDGLVREDFWKTKEQLQSAVVGCYASMVSGGQVANLFIWGEIRADMITLTTNASVDETSLTNGEILSTNAFSDWGTLYSTINYCNTVIQYGPGVISNDNTLTQAQLDAYLSEAYSIRALMYFYLLRIWGEVPLQLKASSSDSKIEQLPKSTKEQVYAQILSDLDFAVKYIPFTYGSQAMDKGRMTRYGVYALQADVYLWNEKYAECITACNAIINSAKFGLIDGSSQSNWFNTLVFVGNSNESIFELQYDSQILNPFYAMFSPATTRRYLAASRVTDNMYGIDTSDPNKKDIRSDAGFVRASDFTIWKWIGTNDLTITRAQPDSYAHWMVYRLADVLLLKAEALAWTSKGAEALALVKTIRTRAGAVSASEESPDPSNAQDISDYILRERGREFAFEGKRWFDYLRNAKRNNYAHLDLITSMIADIAPPNRQQSMISKYRDVRSHYMPIFLNELNTDKQLVQNPFYQ
ncbi:RagB/SusD family nutrient uptake outer membrane protein [Pedobacter sp. HMF7056]|uniref:RagB/SusD family nutrient uptake outer membrane protein n=2 Tax=Hufsiella ginkgonis TaxID=2695274 RepID=A0A7K1Y278_9SPHI|nr:RagB/SusD family nutrient uptake outer membrane protein [Hufsiella ginkgonis]